MPSILNSTVLIGLSGLVSSTAVTLKQERVVLTSKCSTYAPLDRMASTMKSELPNQ